MIKATWSSFCKKRVMFCGWTLDVAPSFSVLFAARTGAFSKGRTGVAVKIPAGKKLFCFKSVQSNIRQEKCCHATAAPVSR